MEDSLYDIASMRRFAGVDLERIPDESTVLNFRHFLERHGLTEKLFRKTEKYLADKVIDARQLSEGTIVDATIINVHLRPRTRTGSGIPR